MSDFTFKLEKNGNSHEILTPEGRIPVSNGQGCMIKLEKENGEKEGEFIVKKLILQHAFFSNRTLLKHVQRINIEDSGTTASIIVDLDFREKVGVSGDSITYNIENTWVSFHIKREKQDNDEVDYLVVNSKPEM